MSYHILSHAQRKAFVLVTYNCSFGVICFYSQLYQEQKRQHILEIKSVSFSCYIGKYNEPVQCQPHNYNKHIESLQHLYSCGRICSFYSWNIKTLDGFTFLSMNIAPQKKATHNGCYVQVVQSICSSSMSNKRKDTLLSLLTIRALVNDDEI